MMMNNEPRVVPFSPGAVLVRLSEIIGAVKMKPELAKAFPEDASSLETQRALLLGDIELGDPLMRRAGFEHSQQLLMRIYEKVSQPGIWSADEAAENFRLLGFPDPLREEGDLQKVDVSSVLATFTQPQKQVFTTLTFDDAPGAIAYWLRETRVVADEEIHDDLIENFAPVFQRVRLATGAHRFRIESRNLHNIALSDEFTIEIPAPLSK